MLQPCHEFDALEITFASVSTLSPSSSVTRVTHELFDPIVQWSGGFRRNPMIDFFNENQLTHWQSLMQHFGVRMEVLVFFSVNEQYWKLDFPKLRCTVILQAVLIILFRIFSISFFRIIE